MNTSSEPPITCKGAAAEGPACLGTVAICGTGGRSWEDRWKMGRIWEEAALEMLRSRGWMTLPVASISTGPEAARGPMFQGVGSEYLSAPDVLACKDGKSAWFEIKYKADTTLHRNTGRTEVGIPARLWGHYMGVAKETGLPVVLSFVVGSSSTVLLGEIGHVSKTKRSYRGPNMPNEMLFFDVRRFKQLPIEVVERCTVPVLQCSTGWV